MTLESVRVMGDGVVLILCAVKVNYFLTHVHTYVYVPHTAILASYIIVLSSFLSITNKS